MVIYYTSDKPHLWGHLVRADELKRSLRPCAETGCGQWFRMVCLDELHDIIGPEG